MILFSCSNRKINLFRIKKSLLNKKRRKKRHKKSLEKIIALNQLLTLSFFSKNRTWQRGIFPYSLPYSIFPADTFHVRVRDGNGWFDIALSPSFTLTTT